MNKVIFIAVGIGLLTITYMWLRKGSESADNNTIVVGTNAEFPPFTFLEGKKIVGFDIDVIKEVAKRINKKIILKDMTFDALIPEIQLGRVHVIAAGMTPTPERAKRVFFTKPHLHGDTLLMIGLASSPTINSVDDLKGKEVAVNEGYTSDFYMSEIPEVRLKRLSTSLISEGILAVKSGRTYAFVAAKQSVQSFLDTTQAADLQVMPIEGTNESSAFAISKFFPDLVKQMQHALDTMEADGALLAIKQKWNLK